MTMFALSQNLLYAQQLRHVAATAERVMLTDRTTDTPKNRGDVADLYALANQAAGAFAVFADYHPAANDEPITTHA